MSDQKPPVASSQQGGTPCLGPTCDCCRVHTRTEREMEARIRELEDLLADVYREATDGDTGHTVARHIELGAPGIAFPTLNRETSDD